MTSYSPNYDLPYQTPGQAPPPLNTAVLTKDVGGPMLMGVRSIVSGHPASGLTPDRLGRILREAETGDAIAYLELAEQIEEVDLHYRSVLSVRKMAVTQLKVTVEPASDSADDMANAALIEDWLKRDTLEEELFDILDGIGKGFSMTEIIWETSAKEWMPKSLTWRDPRWWIMDRVDGVTPLMRDLAGFLPMDPYKWVYHVSKSKSGLPIRGGLARPVSWFWMFKNYAVKDWIAFAEVFGMPLRVGKYEPGESEANIKLLMSAVANMGSDAAAVIAKSMDIEFVGAGQGGQATGEVFERLCNYCDTQISKGVLGQTATTDAIAGGHAVGKTHDQVRGDIKRADAAQLQATLNRDLVRGIIFLNRGEPKGGVYPRIIIDEEDDPLEVGAMSTALGLLVPLGLKVSERDVRQRLGFPDPQPDDEVLAPPQPPPALQAPGDETEDEDGPKPVGPTEGQEAQGADVDDAASALRGREPTSTAPVGHGQRPSRFLRFSNLLKGRPRGRPAPAVAVAASGAAPATDAIDHGVDAALTDWRPIAQSLTSPIEQALDSATDLEDFRDRLADLVGSMSVDEVGQLLAESSFAARLAGRTKQGLS